jgi:hypothetical protein
MNYIESVSLGNVEELQKAASYFAFKNSAKALPVLGIIFGIIVGFYGLLVGVGAGSFVYFLLALFGFLLLCVSLWWLIAKNLNVFLCYGIISCITGGLSVIINAIAIAIMGEGILDFIFLMLGVFTFEMGILAFNYYGRLSHTPMDPSSKEMLDKVSNIIQPIVTADLSKETDVIQFQRRRDMEAILWKGKFNGDNIIFTSIKRDEIFFINRKDIEITTNGKTFKRTGLSEAAFKVGGLSFKGGIDTVYLERFKMWKNLH